MSVARTAGFALASAAIVAGHGYVSGIVADGTYYGGYLVNQYPYSSDPPAVVGWTESATDLGFVDGSSYTSGDIICHKDATNAQASATVAAGGTVELQWTEWPESHHGPVIDYIASCNGDCTTVDKATLEWVKISESGLIDGSSAPGTWASDNLIANNNSWTVTIPSSLAAGGYVLRHEIIALHSAGNENGAQNYPQCVNLEITGGGSASPSGTVGTELYTPTDPGILVNIYTSLDSYDIPGPALWDGASSSGSGSNSASASSSAAATSTPTTSSVSVPVIPTASSGASSTPLVPTPSAPAVTPSAPAGNQVPRPTYTSTYIETETLPGQTITSTATEYASEPTQPAVETQVAQPSETEAATSTSTATETASATAAPTGSSSGSSSGSGSSSTELPTDSSSLSDYFNSLSAEEFLNLLKETLKWLVTDKVHARSLH
ncbi:glycosyl hydrolase family 61-domain-containing protein [Aspergillus falconensis]